MTTRNNGLRIIAALEAVKGILVLIAAGAGAWFLHDGARQAIEATVRHFHMNPARDHAGIFVQSLVDFGNTHALALSAGAIAYAMLRFVEAYGLWHARKWAWGFGILSASIYVPLEIVELARQVTWVSLLVLAVNVSIVAVLWHERRSTG